MKKILYYGLSDKEIKLLKDNIIDCEIRILRVGHKDHKDKIKNDILELLKHNDSIEANNSIANKFGLQSRTLSRYIRELKEDNLIKAEIVRLKGGGRGYKIESVISKKTKQQKKV
jgi:DNA-binding Lrp family transcriptional regulator